MLNGKQSKVLPAINGAPLAALLSSVVCESAETLRGRVRAALKKLCNHPKLIYDMLAKTTEAAADGFKDCEQFFPPVCTPGPLLLEICSALRSFVCCRAPSTTAASAAACLRPGGRPTGERLRAFATDCRGADRSALITRRGKFLVLARLLDYLRAHTTDRIVLVSNYTQTLDLFQAFCRERCGDHEPALRVCGAHLIPCVAGATRLCAWTARSPSPSARCSSSSSTTCRRTSSPSCCPPRLAAAA